VEDNSSCSGAEQQGSFYQSHRKQDLAQVIKRLKMAVGDGKKLSAHFSFLESSQQLLARQ